jgi:hypothetical protein
MVVQDQVGVYLEHRSRIVSILVISEVTQILKQPHTGLGCVQSSNLCILTSAIRNT